MPERQKLVNVELEQGSSVADALEASGLYDAFSDVDFAALETGIWGRLVVRDQVLVSGDRVEVYRPLRMDPREARRLKVGR